MEVALLPPPGDTQARVLLLELKRKSERHLNHPRIVTED